MLLHAHLIKSTSFETLCFVCFLFVCFAFNSCMEYRTFYVSYSDFQMMPVTCILNSKTLMDSNKNHQQKGQNLPSHKVIFLFAPDLIASKELSHERLRPWINPDLHFYVKLQVQPQPAEGLVHCSSTNKNFEWNFKNSESFLSKVS